MVGDSSFSALDREHIFCASRSMLMLTNLEFENRGKC